jgi:hypothetical protein
MDPLSPSLDDYSTVVSILPVRLSDKKPGLIPGTYELEAVKDPMTEYSSLVIGRAKFPVYIDENRPSLMVPEPSDRVAAAIVRDYKVAMDGYNPPVAEPGLFWVRGGHEHATIGKKFAAELTEARKRQIEWFKFIISRADDDWEKYHMRRMITGLQRIACQLMKLDRPWSIDVQFDAAQSSGYVKCPFCFGEVHPEAVLCMHCRNVLNEAKHKVLLTVK